MMSKSIQSNPDLVDLCERASRYIGTGVAALGVLVLIGWVANITVLTSIIPGLATMKFNTALMFILSGGFLASEDSAFRYRRIITIVIIAVAGLTFLEYLLGWYLGIDELFIQDTGISMYPGRMAVITAVNFILVGVSLLLLRKQPLVAQATALLVWVLALLALAGYTYNVESLYSIIPYSTVALHTAVGFLAIASGILMRTTDYSFMRISVSDSAGGLVIRRLLPFSGILLFVFGWLRLQGQNLGFYDSQFGTALLTVISILVLSFVIIRTAYYLHHIDIQRMLAEESLREYQDELEIRVQERTTQRDILNERLNVIFETTNDAIMLVDADGLIELVNPAFMRQFGYNIDEIIHKPLSLVVAPEKRDELETSLREVIATDDFSRIEMTALRKDGSTFDIEISLSRVVENQDHLVCNLHDISHYKTMERMKDNFVTMVNHELRTPIASIMLSIDMMVKYFEKMPEEKIREKLVESYGHVITLGDIVEGILSDAELRSRDGQPVQTSVVMLEILKRVVNELNPNAAAKQQVITISAIDEPTPVKGNMLDFTRIWRNLISNAIKYTPEHGAIFARLAFLKRDDPQTLMRSELSDKTLLATLLNLSLMNYVVGQVEDTGHGIRSEDIEHVFERFNRGWAKGTNIPGTGLGLSFVKDLLAVYDGDIYVSSEVDKGSIFTFWIPID